MPLFGFYLQPAVGGVVVLLLVGLPVAALLASRRRAAQIRRLLGAVGSRPRAAAPAVVALVLLSALVAVATLHDKPKETLAGIAILLTGIPVYFLMRRKRTT